MMLPALQAGQRMAASENRIAPPLTGSSPSAERRSHSRHAVDTTANLILIKTGFRLPGSIVDLSIGGCRIFREQRFPVGIFTRIEAEFRFEGALRSGWAALCRASTIATPSAYAFLT